MFFLATNWDCCSVVDEQYLKENYAIKENHAYSSQENYRMKHAEVSAN